MNEATAPTSTSDTGADQPMRLVSPLTATVTTTKDTIQMIATTESCMCPPPYSLIE
jgi:hypothetical protein